METLSVRCNHCGAPLQIAENTRFVTCQFCSSNLEVKRNETSVFTEEVAKIAENTGRMAQSLEAIRIQNEIEQLDRDFTPERLHEMAGRIAPGSRQTGGCVGVVFMLIFTSFGLFFATTSAELGAPFIFQIVGGGFALIGIISLVGIVRQFLSNGPNSAAAEYQRRRAELALKLEELSKK